MSFSGRAALDGLPLDEPLPIRRVRADEAVRPCVRGDEQRVEPEQRRDLLLEVR